MSHRYHVNTPLGMFLLLYVRWSLICCYSDCLPGARVNATSFPGSVLALGTRLEWVSGALSEHARGDPFARTRHGSPHYYRSKYRCIGNSLKKVMDSENKTDKKRKLLNRWEWLFTTCDDDLASCNVLLILSLWWRFWCCTKWLKARRLWKKFISVTIQTKHYEQSFPLWWQL